MITYHAHLNSEMAMWLHSLERRVSVEIGETKTVDLHALGIAGGQQMVIRRDPSVITFWCDADASMFALKFKGQAELYLTEILIKDDYDY